MTAPLGARVALVGYTGTGKTTIATGLLHELRRHGQPAQLVKLSAPMYRLQQVYYAEAGISLAPGTQDQELMAEIAGRLRQLSPNALLKQFLATVAEAPPGATRCHQVPPSSTTISVFPIRTQPACARLDSV